MKDIEIIYQNKDIIVVNKPAGLMVHGVAGHISAEPTLVDILLKKYPEIKTVGDEPGLCLGNSSSGSRGSFRLQAENFSSKYSSSIPSSKILGFRSKSPRDIQMPISEAEPLRPGIVHRLDKDTSGVMVVARNQKSFEYLKSLFQGRDIKKTYVAVVSGVPKEKQGIIDKPIGIRIGTTKRSVESKKMAKSAVTEYEVLKTAQAEDGHGKESSFALLSVSPRTGRTHQIRVHLTSIGHPIVGDPLYGPKKQPPWADRLMLHAASIEFSDNSGHRLRFDAEEPKEFEDCIK